MVEKLNVTALMLTRDRPEMAARALRCFRAQVLPSWLDARLLVINTGAKFVRDPEDEGEDVVEFLQPENSGHTIGWNRNRGLFTAGALGCDIVIHWDDDDLHLPGRIARQVSQLRTLSAERPSGDRTLIGYRRLWFADSRGGRPEAWLYRHDDPRYCVGASLCYWFRAWECVPFPDAPHEDQRRWLTDASHYVGLNGAVEDPVLFCTIHGHNTEAYRIEDMRASANWRRAPEADERVAECLKL